MCFERGAIPLARCIPSLGQMPVDRQDASAVGRQDGRPNRACLRQTRQRWGKY